MQQSKTGFIIYLLTDDLAWISLYLEQGHAILGDRDNFVAAMNLIFDYPNLSATAEAITLSLHQQKCSIGEYAAEFYCWVSNTTWNDSVQHFNCRKGL